MIKEKNLHQKQFIDCHKKLNASNDLVKKLENIIHPDHSKRIEKKLDDEVAKRTAMKYSYETDSLASDDEADSLHGIADLRSSSDESCDSDYTIERTSWDWPRQTEHLSYVFKICDSS